MMTFAIAHAHTTTFADAPGDLRASAGLESCGTPWYPYAVLVVERLTETESVGVQAED